MRTATKPGRKQCSMTTDLISSMTNDGYRCLLEDLRTDVGARIRAEKALAAAESFDDGAERRRLERTLQLLTERLQQDRALVDERHVTARQALDDRFRAEMAGIRAEYCR